MSDSDQVAQLTAQLNAALAAPLDDSALRAFGLRVAWAARGKTPIRWHRDEAAVVDAVMRGES